MAINYKKILKGEKNLDKILKKSEKQQKILERDNTELVQAGKYMAQQAFDWVLIDENGVPSDIDFRSDVEKMRDILANVQLWRQNSAVRNKKAVQNVNITIDDIQAVLFKPIINVRTSNTSYFQGASVFKLWLNDPRISLNDRIESVGNVRPLRTAYQKTLFRLRIFESQVLAYINDPARFIEALLDVEPSAFGNPS